jgi:hypothetical protein
MHKDFDKAAKEILNLSDRAILPFLNASFSASHPPGTPITRLNTEYRLPSAAGEKYPQDKTIIADALFLVGHTCRYHLEVQLDRRGGMALRMFRYDAAEALEHPREEDGVMTISFPQSLVIYLEPSPAAPDYGSLRVRFPDGACYDYRTPVIKLPELTVQELAERHLLIFAPLYPLKLRKRMRRAKTGEERRQLAAELKQLYRELGEALRGAEAGGTLTDIDEEKVMRMSTALHRRVYGEYTEFEEDNMGIPEDMRLIEKLHAERDEARARAAELEKAREDVVRQRLRDTARNILRLGLPVEQVAQATGLPPETVGELAAQL